MIKVRVTKKEIDMFNLSRILIILTLICIYTRMCEAETIAIIVNQENGASELSFKELVSIFKAEKQHWDKDNTGRIYLTMRESGSKEKEAAMKLIYRMSEGELKKFWIGKIYRGEVADFPKVFESDISMKKFVLKVKNAIGIISSANTDDTIKVLSIDGKLPGEDGYKLTFQGDSYEVKN